MWVKLIRFSKGTVAFRIQGTQIEKFINSCVAQNIRIRDYSTKENELMGIVDAKKYKQMAQVAKKCGVKSRVIAKNGAVFITRRYKKRYGILVGALIFATFVYSMGLFLWDIQINCSDKIDKESLLSFANENGLRIGTFSKSVDVKGLEQSILLKYDDISWVAVNIKGSKAVLEVKESKKPPEIINHNQTVNVVSTQSGVITNMEVYNGIPVVKKGDLVQKGDLLVSGIVETKLGVTIPKHARAKIEAEVEKTLEVRVPMKQKVEQPTGEIKTKQYIEVFGQKIPLSFKKIKEPYHLSSSKEPIKFFNITLPMHLITEQYEILTYQEVLHTKESAKTLALADLNEIKKEVLLKDTILKESLNGTIQGQDFILMSRVLVRTDISKEEVIS